jgi:hypothetical protein
MTILLRRFTIICLTFLVFALAMVMIVNNHARRPTNGQFALGAPCPQPAGIHCTSSN